MKTNQTTPTKSSAVAAMSAQVTAEVNKSLTSAIPVVLIECLQKIKEVRNKIDVHYKSSQLQQ